MNSKFLHEINRTTLLSQIWILASLLYLFRAIAEPLKYLFIISFCILILCYLFFTIMNPKKSRILRFIWITKEFHILGLFIVIGLILSSHIEILSIKSLINYLGITVLFLIYFEYENYIQLSKLLKGWIILAIIIGLLGLLKWLNYILGFHLNIFSEFPGYGSSLVSDYNIYSFYNLISIVIFLYALNSKIFQWKFIINQTVLLLLIFNIALAGSRRGIIVLALFFVIGFFRLLLKRKEKQSSLYKILLITYVLFFSIVVIIASTIPFRSKIIQEESTRFKIASSVYRYSTIFNPNITYGAFYNRMWPESANYNHDKTDWKKYATYNNLIDGEIENKYQDLKSESWLRFEESKNPGNLIYNGNFQHGHDFWVSFAPDSVNHKIISTRYGKALRVSRHNGFGNWPLAYIGRKIAYHKDVTYTFTFKYRVIKGDKVPFMIGWWINEGEGPLINLPYKIEDLGNGWFGYSASYRFKKDQSSQRTFMNSQHPNTIVDFAEIELTTDDRPDCSKYLDQLLHIDGANLLYNGNFKSGLKCWGAIAQDSIQHDLIDTHFGKAIRITRKNGNGYWPLIYQGRDIFYHKNLTYYFRFKFRVIKGEGVPFNIGWWLPAEGNNPINLQKRIVPLSEGWFECYTSYKFNNNHYGKIRTFMNSQEANTIIDFTDIEMICNDSLGFPMYADENIDLIRNIERSKAYNHAERENTRLLYKRTSRWKYANEIWLKEYNWQQKLFGGGFDYLEKFGNKFYPDEDRIDYPHNPIISSFLFSGIVGGGFYIYYLVLSFWYYWKYRKHHMLFFSLYLIAFIFIFISGDSHFNVPVFAVLSLVPFITRYFVTSKDS